MKLLCVIYFLLTFAAFGDAPENFSKDKLAAWCIVPFDAKKRGPEERARMLVELGMKRCAYDWRAEHVPQFEEEIFAYKKHGIDFFAFWGEHDSAFALFEKHGLHPQIWKTCPSPKAESQSGKVKAAVKQLTPLVEKAGALGCKVGLYNHGGWGGEPENLAAVCRAFREAGRGHVGIVYNFHHGHTHIGKFAEHFKAMMPFLLCVNLNGMADTDAQKILPIGEGRHETAMIREMLTQKYEGPVGIIDHLPAVDSKISLRKNLDGLRKVLDSVKP